MKKYLLLLPLIALAVVSCKKEQKYALDWDLSQPVKNGITIDSVNILNPNGEVLQTVFLDSANHIKAEGTVEEPTLGTLNLFYSMGGETGAASIYAILEEGTVTIDDNLGVGKGTPLNDAAFGLFDGLVKEFEKEGPGDNSKQLLSDFVDQHKDDVSSVLVLTDETIIPAIFDANVIQEQYDKVNKTLQEHPRMVELKKSLEKRGKSAAGQMFVDFEAEYDGKVQKLSDYVGKGKYVLVDFWASWCGPCRQEIPNLIKIYNDYKGEDFEVLGVATWDEPNDTKKAIEEMGIPYPQIMNAQKAGSDAYSIEGIPEIILFGPDGTILQRGLRGADVEEAVKNALKK